jgi:hypothetical protein
MLFLACSCRWLCAPSPLLISSQPYERCCFVRRLGAYWRAIWDMMTIDGRVIARRITNAIVASGLGWTNWVAWRGNWFGGQLLLWSWVRARVLSTSMSWRCLQEGPMIAPLLIVLSSIDRSIDGCFGSIKKFDKICVKITINSYVSFFVWKKWLDNWAGSSVLNPI